MTTMRDVITRFGFKADTSSLGKIQSSIDSIKHQIMFLASVELLKGLFELTEKFATFAEELHVAAVSAGLTVEQFQELAFSARQAAVSQEELSGAMARISRHLYDARRGGEEAQKAFSAAGFTQDQIAHFRTADDVLMSLGDNFKNIQDPIQKAALATELMGRGSVNMVAWLSQGSMAMKAQGFEARKLGAVLSENQVAALVKVEHALQKVWAVTKAVTAGFAATLAPAIEIVINDFLKFFSANKKIIEVNFESWAEGVAFVLGFLDGFIINFTKRLLKLADAWGITFKFGTFVKDVSAFTIAMVGLGVALKTISIFMALINAENILFVGLMAAAVLTAQALWTVLTGGSLEDSWLGELFSMAKNGSDVLISKIFGVDKFGNQTNQATGGVPASQLVKNVDALNAAPGDFSKPALFQAASSAFSSTEGLTVNIPMTFSNVPAGTNPQDVAEWVGKQTANQQDSALRQLMAAMKGVKSY